MSPDSDLATSTTRRVRVAELLEGFDWPSVSLPSQPEWPQCLRSIVQTMLNSPVPMVLLWGTNGILIYNDGYATFAGAKHPAIFGASAMEAWPEIADWNRARIDDGLKGLSSAYPDQLLVLQRDGVAEDNWLDLSYSPVCSDNGTPAGTLVIVIDVTARHTLEERLIGEREAVAALNRRLAEERDGLRRLFQRAPGFMAAVRGPDHVFEMANEAYLALVGHRDLFGRPVKEALPEIADQGFVQLLDHCYATGEPHVGRAVAISLMRQSDRAPERRYMDFVYQPVRSDSGAVEGIFVQGHDVTERHLAFAGLAESEARFRLIADSAPVPMWVSTPGGRRQFVNRAYQQFLGLPYEDAVGLDWRHRLHPDDLDRVGRESVAGEAAMKPFSLEGRFRRADGEYRWLHSESQPRQAPDGSHAGFVGVAYDVTEARRFSERQRLLINELNHRVKNSLATVQSLAAQSLRPGDEPEAARRRFERRLVALAKAHDVLTRESWDGAALQDIVEEALRPFREGDPRRIEVGGPPLRLPPQAALAMSMTLHELATNAAKYGALSNEDGRVSLRWTASAPEAPYDLEMVWAESGGPPVTPPRRRGFGTRLIELQLAHELEGGARFDFQPDGLVCTLHAPIRPQSAEHLDSLGG